MAKLGDAACTARSAVLTLRREQAPTHSPAEPAAARRLMGCSWGKAAFSMGASEAQHFQSTQAQVFKCSAPTSCAHTVRRAS